MYRDKIEDNWVRPTCANRTWWSNVRGSGGGGLEVDLGLHGSVKSSVVTACDRCFVAPWGDARRFSLLFDGMVRTGLTRVELSRVGSE